MKLDYELLTTILEHIEKATDGQERHTISREIFPDSTIQCVSFDVLAYHFDILCLNESVAGGVLRSSLGGHKVATNIDYFNLTFEGHKLLDCMRNKTLWNNIKFQAKNLELQDSRKFPPWPSPCSPIVQNNAPMCHVIDSNPSVQMCTRRYR